MQAARSAMRARGGGGPVAMAASELVADGRPPARVSGRCDKRPPRVHRAGHRDRASAAGRGTEYAVPNWPGARAAACNDVGMTDTEPDRQRRRILSRR
jgi:hypothetical protein